MLQKIGEEVPHCFLIVDYGRLTNTGDDFAWQRRKACADCRRYFSPRPPGRSLLVAATLPHLSTSRILLRIRQASSVSRQPDV
jgi:hypothetical protein